MNVLPFIKCSYDRNEQKFIGAKFGEYGGCGRTSHPNDFFFLGFLLILLMGLLKTNLIFLMVNSSQM